MKTSTRMMLIAVALSAFGCSAYEPPKSPPDIGQCRATHNSSGIAMGVTALGALTAVGSGVAYGVAANQDNTQAAVNAATTGDVALGVAVLGLAIMLAEDHAFVAAGCEHAGESPRRSTPPTPSTETDRD